MNKIKLKLLFVLIIFIGTFIVSIKVLDNTNIVTVDEEMLGDLISSTTNMNTNSFRLVKYIKRINLFDNTYVFKENVVDPAPTIIVSKDERPLIYIYNTHQKENYETIKNSQYDVTTTVLHASYILKEKLEEYDILSFVEEEDISSLLKINAWNYASSYKVTKFLLEQAIIDNPDFKIFIDLHRDSVKRSISTITIKDKTYARIMFVVGMSHLNYQENLDNANIINNYITNNYPGLSRGVYKKNTSMGNGIYNQDFNSQCFLIEVGGEENNITEVTNTLEVIAEAINIYLGDKNV